VTFLFVIFSFVVYNHTGEEFYFFFWMNSLGSYSGACLGSCLQGKPCFRDWPFVGPCWKPSTFYEVSSTSVDSVSSSRPSTS